MNGAIAGLVGRFRSLPLLAQLLVPYTLASLVIAAVASTVAVASGAQAVLQQAASRARAEAAAVSAGAESDGGDPAMTRSLISRYMQSWPDVRDAEVYVLRDGSLQLALAEDMDRGIPRLGPAAVGSPSSQREVRLGGQHLLLTQKSIRAGGVSGMVLVGSSLAGADRAVTGVALRIALTAIIAALGAFLLAVVVLWFGVMVPLRKLTAVASRVTAERSSQPQITPDVGTDELTQLALELDLMVQVMHQRAAQQAAIAEIGRIGLVESDLDTIMARSSQLIADTLAVRYVGISEADSAEGQLVLRSVAIGTGPAAASGARDSATLSEEYAGYSVSADPAQTQAGYTLGAGRAVIANDLETETRFGVYPELRARGIKSCLTVPIRADGAVSAVLGAYAIEKGRFTAEDASFLEAAGNVVAEALARSHVTRALSDGEARLAHIFETVSEAIVLVDREGRATFANAAAERILGYPRDEIVGRRYDSPKLHWVGLDGTPIDGDDRARIWGLLMTGQSVHGLLRTITNGRGEKVIISINITPDRHSNGEMIGMIASVSDITERVLAEQQLRETLNRLQQSVAERKRLVHRLVGSEEEQRRRIAADIHDDFLQLLTASTLRLERLRRRLSDPSQLAVLDDLEKSVGLSVSRLRQLVFELRPKELEVGGLDAAIRASLEELRTETGIKYRFENRLTADLPMDVRVVAYRIAREVLANVRRHARASALRLFLDQRDGGVCVVIKDDGVGFELAEGRKRHGHLGLALMVERAEMMGGWCHFRTAPGAGTEVEFWLPLEQVSPMETESGVAV